MKLMTIRSTEIRSSIPVLLLFPVFAVFGRLGSFFIAFISLILHESAHTIIAERLGCRVASIDIQPYGCVAKLANKPVSDADAAEQGDNGTECAAADRKDAHCFSAADLP